MHHCLISDTLHEGRMAGLEEGHTAGHTAGLAEGHMAGLVEGKTEVLMALLHHKFPKVSC